MKALPIIAASLMAMGGISMGGRPIILSEADACAQADLVVLATVGEARKLPADEPFGGSKWNSFGFTKVAESKNTKTLMGKRPEKLHIYGGKLQTGTDYRLESGNFLLLLSKVGDGAYRAVDWHYSFMPIKDGKVSWLIDRLSNKREWITLTEAKRRIEAHKLKSEQDGADQPAIAPESKPEGNSKPQPDPEGRSH